MPFPKTRDELVAAGYSYDNDATCKGCGDAIEWWTTPNGRKMPMNEMRSGADRALAHFSSCSDAPLFRKSS